MVQSSTLNAIGLKHGTDKASSHHNYLQFYELFFAPLRNEKLAVLEIGVLDGASLKTWEEYFPNANVIGVDIVAVSKRFERNRIEIVVADQSNIEELTSIGIKRGPFDIIIEDGSHIWDHQITSLQTLFPFLKNGGIYIVEDLQTNYGSMRASFQGIARSSCVEYLKVWLDLLVADDQININGIEDAFLRTYGRAVDFITFYRHACLMKKHFAPVVRELDAGRPVVAISEDGQSAPLLILAHVGNKGDILGRSGFVNLESESFPIQGFLIDLDGGAVEYRVRFPDDSWSPWTREGKFAGTRGKSKSLTGFTIRILDSIKERYTLRSFGRFAGGGDPVEVSDGQDCISVSGTELCGIQVKLTSRGIG